jgi:hypothetical protein
MDRAERRRRTEVVRDRRIDRYNQIDNHDRSKSEDARFRYLMNRGWRWSWIRSESKVLQDMEEDRLEYEAICGRMRNEYIVGYRDYDWWRSSREIKMSIADDDYRFWLKEAGLRYDIKRYSLI